MRRWVTTFAEVAGLAAVTVGAGLVYVPAGVIAGGLSLLAVGLFGWEAE